MANKEHVNSGGNGIAAVAAVFFILCIIIGSCIPDSDYSSNTPATNNDYQDMRSKGHSEEDAVIFSILKQQGYSDYEALRATKASGE